MCPNCQKPTECGCGSCTKRNGINENTEIWDSEKDLITCPHCKQTFDINVWADFDFERYDLSQITKSQIVEKNID